MSKIRVKPVLIHSAEPSNVGTHLGKLYYSEFGPHSDNWINKQLILISLDPEEKIKEGDIAYYRMYDGYKSVVKVDESIITNPEQWRGFKKVIATQDKISPKDIQKIIDYFNLNGKFEEVIYLEAITQTVVSGGLVPVGQVGGKGLQFHSSTNLKLTNGFVTIIDELPVINFKDATLQDMYDRGFPKIVETSIEEIKDEIIGKPLEDYIRAKHSQDRCMGFIDGYTKRKEEELEERNKLSGFLREESDAHLERLIENHKKVNNPANTEELYNSIIDSISSFKVLEENKIKEYNSKVKKVNKELKYANDFEELESLDWFNETVELNKIRNNVIELFRLLNKKK